MYTVFAIFFCDYPKFFLILAFNFGYVKLFSASYRVNPRDFMAYFFSFNIDRLKVKLYNK